MIPAHDEARSIADVIGAVSAQEPPHTELEVIVVDDASTDETRARARAAGARVIELDPKRGGGNPAAARNVGAAASGGDPIIFLDADCIPQPGWLTAILKAHEAGWTVVGGALDLPPGLSPTARCDYYCGWYLIHSGRSAGPVPHHPPPNLSVRREAFLATSGFTEAQPYSYTNEERMWQCELREAGLEIWFEPTAIAHHFNRPGFRNLLRRNYRWAYTAVAAKHETESARMAWLYRYPMLAILGSVPFSIAQGVYILACWMKARRFEPLLMLPGILVSRMAYAAGMSVGGLRWLREKDGQRSGRAQVPGARPR